MICLSSIDVKMSQDIQRRKSEVRVSSSLEYSKDGSPTFNVQVRPITLNAYDTLGRLTQVQAGYTTDLSGAAGADVPSTQMSYVYDDFGRKLKDIDGLNRAWVYSYDVNGNVSQITDPKGQNTTLSPNRRRSPTATPMMRRCGSPP